MILNYELKKKKNSYQVRQTKRRDRLNKVLDVRLFDNGVMYVQTNNSWLANDTK